MNAYGSICTGGALADIGVKAAGWQPAWGIELEPQIAEVANHNLGSHVMVANLLDVDPRRLEPVDALHASPPCPNFSAAKIGGAETALDIAIADKVAEFIRTLKPRVFTLENVLAYRHGKGWTRIEHTLWQDGYWLHVDVLNAADFGVPQTRKRMIVRAVRGGLVPQLPAPLPWRGWYDAIADLIPELPESQFAPWQLERLPKELSTMLVSGGGSHFDSGEKQVAQFEPDEPAMTVLTGSVGRVRAFIVHPTDFRTMPVRQDEEPAFTCMAGTGTALNMPRAYLVDGSNTHGTTRSPTVRSADDPSFTITASKDRSDIRSLAQDGRIVKMTPRALARFQGVPDSYELPEKKALACRIIGNGCPPPMFEAIYRGLS